MPSLQSPEPFAALVLHLSQRACAGGLKVYLLLDQSGLPNINHLWLHLKRQPWATLLAPQAGQPDGGSPLLFDVSSASSSRVSERTLKLVHEQGRFANCLSVLCSSLGIEELAAALRERAAAELPDGLSVILRFFDGRTLPLLPRMLTATQYGAFLACVESWYWVDRHGHIRVMPEATHVAAGDTPFPWRLDAAQERLLMEDGLADGVIDQLLNLRHPALRQHNPAEQFDLILPLVASASNYLIDDVLDATAYCLAALEHGAEFNLREPWCTKLEAYRSGELELHQALAHA